MKNLTILLVSFALCAMTSLASAADISLVTADMNRLFENYHRAADAQKRFQSSVEAAESQAKTILDERQELIQEYEKMLEDAESPALSAEARDRAQVAAEEKRQEIQDKERDFQQFQANTRAMLEQQRQNHHQLMMDEIKEVVLGIAKERGANLVLDSSAGGLQMGGSSVIYADPAFDVTDEALEELNKDSQ